MFERLLIERERCSKAYDIDNNIEHLMKIDCIDHFFECETYIKYQKILDFAKENNLKRVFDIGCAYGHQSEIFLNEPVEYIGINDAKSDYWNKDKFQYITKEYPFMIKANKNDLATSVLCLTWNCYLYKKDTLYKQCEALSRDFTHCLLYMPKDKINFVKKYFTNYKIIDKSFVYFYN